jgi:hypothetical protein
MEVNMNKLYVLKITSEDNILLNSINANQEISPLNFPDIQRNINGDAIPTLDKNLKFRTKIQTTDCIETALLSLDREFTIYSTVVFKQKKGPEPVYLRDPVPKSLQEVDSYVMYRPILKTFLADFQCTNHKGQQSWNIFFEEV